MRSYSHLLPILSSSSVLSKLPSRKSIGALVRVGLLATTLSLASCQTVKTTKGGTVGVERKQRMGVSAQAVEQASAKAYTKMMSKARQKGKLNTDRYQYDRVQRISRNIIAQVGVFRPDARNWNWEVNLIKDDKQVNAFCMAGGKIAIFSGFIKKMKPTDDELAAVIGHEVSHALREHVREQISAQQGMGAASILAGILLGSQEAMQTTSRILNVGYGLKYSRKAEVESDSMGVELAARAGYDPRAAITLWQKMSRIGGRGVPEFLSTHPAPKNRIANLRRDSAKVMALYQARRGYR